MKIENQQLKTRVLMLLLTLSLLLMGGCSAQSRVLNAGTDSDFSFVYMSDPQADPQTGDYEKWGQLLQRAAADKTQPVFLMIGGDLVNDGNEQQEWDAFFAAGGKVLEKMPIYPAVGNHDNSKSFKSRFDLPDNGPAGNGVFYSFDYKDTHFTVMDSNLMGADRPEDIKWLQQDLTSSDKTYKIVMFHHPAYPAVDIPKDNARAATIQQKFVPVMEAAGVDLVLSGHQHVYMRSYPMLKGVRNDNGIIYLMGNSGGKSYTPGKYDYSACSIGNQAVYTIVSVNDKGVFLETRNAGGAVLDSNRGPNISAEQKDLSITVRGDGIKGEKRLTFGELCVLPDSGFQHVFSTINNWPTSRFYAARGINVRTILKEAGVLDTAQILTFRSPDSYEVSFTREQLLGPRYYYPKVKEGSAELAEPVEPIITYEYKEGSADMKAAQPDEPCLIIGQTNPGEHTNPAFVVNVSEIIVSAKPAEAWETASTFPQEGIIAAGETVKLQHKSFGLVKLHYTLDGSEPSELSPMYNPSTYQPELNVPIKINKDTIIKVMVTGYGKKNSEVKSFSFTVQ